MNIKNFLRRHNPWQPDMPLWINLVVCTVMIGALGFIGYWVYNIGWLLYILIFGGIL